MLDYKWGIERRQNKQQEQQQEQTQAEEPQQTQPEPTGGTKWPRWKSNNKTSEGS